MILITDKAAEQFKTSIERLGEDNPVLRISARMSPDHGIVYKMGFDEAYETDVSCDANGIKVVFDKDSEPHVKGMAIEFGELDGKEQFIFINPNDTKAGSFGSVSEGSDRS